MKAPNNNVVQKVLLRKKSNDRIDAAIETGKRHKADPLEITLLDKVMRPFALILIDERHRPDADANEVKASVCAMVANLMAEFLQQIVEKGDQEGLVMQANDMLTQMSEHFAFCLQANYGLTVASSHGSVGTAPKE